jgi:putative DNA-invertase from lambdoid prophage Rac
MILSWLIIRHLLLSPSPMTRIAYYRVSTTDQSIEAQRHAMGGEFAMEFQDEGVSGAIPAAERPGFAAMLTTIKAMKRKPELCVYAVDRLGRDSIDVQTTVRDLRAAGVRVNIHGLGVIEGDTGELLLTLLAQFAQMERNRIRARADAGREAARDSLSRTGLTHRGKVSLGRPVKGDAQEVAAWRFANGASIAATAEHWGLSLATVKRYCVQGTAEV